MIEAAVFESVVKVVDKFAELLKFRHERRREFFTSVLEPLFEDLMVMHTDYIAMFDDCRAKLLDGAPLQEVASALARRRVVYDGLRIKSRAFLAALKETELDEQFKQFLAAAAYHIPDGELGPVTSTPASLVLRKIYGAHEPLVDSPHKKGSSPLPGDRRYILDTVISTTNHIRERWAWICESYVKAKVWSLK